MAKPQALLIGLKIMKKDHWCTTYQLLQSVYTHMYTAETWPNGQGKKQQEQGGTSSDCLHEALKDLHEHRDSCPPCINHFSDIK